MPRLRLGLVWLSLLVNCVPMSDSGVDAGKSDGSASTDASSGGGGADGGRDGGSSDHDGGATLLDAGTDAGSFSDAGGFSDAGAASDAGAQTDAGMQPMDSGSGQSDAGHDAGSATQDGGVDTGLPESDAGSVSDAGSSSGGKSILDPDVLPCGQLGDLSAPSGPLLELGHTSEIKTLVHSTNRVLSAEEGHWNLWHDVTQAIIAAGDIPSDGSGDSSIAWQPVSAGDVFVVVGSANSLELRSMETGEVITTFAAAISTKTVASTPWGLSTDGSYAWLATSSALTAWSSSGQILAQIDGNYEGTIIFADPQELRVVGGPAGADVIESVSTATGASTTSAAFAGTFAAWFFDGSRFLTSEASATPGVQTVRVYSLDIDEQANAAVKTDGADLHGQGDYFWFANTTATGYGDRTIVTRYSVADAAAQPATFLMEASERIFSVDNNQVASLSPFEISIIDLRFPNTSDGMAAALPGLSVAARSYEGHWVFGTRNGVVADSDRYYQPFSCGAVTSIAGANDGTVAIVAPWNVMLFDVLQTPRRYLGATGVWGSKAELSQDGSVLAVGMDKGDAFFPDGYDGTDVSVVSLPDGVLKATVPDLAHFSLSANGHWLSEITQENSEPIRRVADTKGNAPVFSLPGSQLAALSPDGSLVAMPDGPADAAGTQTTIYQQGSVIGTVSGFPVAWLDDSHVLVSWTDGTHDGSYVYTSTGQLVQTGVLPRFDTVRVLGPDSVYWAKSNAIYELSTGTKTWTGNTPATRGSVAADAVVYHHDSRIYVQPR